MRVVVIGSTGSGKTTLGKSLAARLAVPFIELDALHWEACWTPLTKTDPEEFIRRVDAATAANAWVLDGNYHIVRHLTWGRATHLAWLDYGRPLIMYRVIRRTLVRSMRGTALWAGNRERWRNLLRPDHPIWWAWRTWRRHRREWAEALGRDEYAHLVVARVGRPAEVAGVIQQLTEAAAAQGYRIGVSPD